MEEVTKTVSGFRAAIQDLLVPELKAVQTEIRGVKESLDRHEKRLEKHEQMLSKLVEEIHQLREEMGSRFAVLQKQMDERFAALQKQMDERFMTAQKENSEKFNAIMELIRELQKSTGVIMERLNYSERINQQNERIHQLELHFARLSKTTVEKASEPSKETVLGR